MNYAIITQHDAGLWATASAIRGALREHRSIPSRGDGPRKAFHQRLRRTRDRRRGGKGAGSRLPPRTRRGDRVHGGPRRWVRRRRSAPRWFIRVRKAAGEPGKFRLAIDEEPAATEHLLPRPDRGTHPQPFAHPAAGEGYVHHVHAPNGKLGGQNKGAPSFKRRARLTDSRYFKASHPYSFGTPIPHSQISLCAR